MEKYKYVVSLGSFCSPAKEFKRINRRQLSLPFDWLITPEIRSVMLLIDNGFQDFLNKEYMFQFKNNLYNYKNQKYNIDFYHDFSKYKSFNSQIKEVTKKYNRRIKRFYDIIKQPTLFLRYITEADIEYITQNYDSILHELQKFNSQNDIIFVANDDIDVSFNTEFPVFYVKKDINDSVSREFLNANNELLQFILENVEEAMPKQKNEKTTILSLIRKINHKIRVYLNLVYHHNKQC